MIIHNYIPYNWKKFMMKEVPAKKLKNTSHS